MIWEMQGEKDWKKYETARKLHSHVDKIRSDYRRDLKSKEMRLRQRAVALYFIDKVGRDPIDFLLLFGPHLCRHHGGPLLSCPGASPSPPSKNAINVAQLIDRKRIGGKWM